MKLMSTQFANTGNGVANNVVDDYNVDVVDDSVAADVDIMVIEDDEPEIEILGAEYGDADVEVSLFADDDSVVHIDVLSDDDLFDSFDIPGDIALDDAILDAGDDNAYEANIMDDVDDVDAGDLM